jgi:hypothetical protein
MAIKRLPILRVVQIGNDEFERYLIEDQKSRKVWNGQRFKPEGGTLYADHNAAATDVQTILRKNFEGVEPQRYVVPVCIEVFSHEPVPVAQVAQYLSRVSRLFLNTTDHGNGPGSSLVLPRIEWHRIEPSKESPHE